MLGPREFILSNSLHTVGGRGGGRDGTGRGEWGGDDGTGAWDKGVVMLNVFIGVLAILVSLGQEF